MIWGLEEKFKSAIRRRFAVDFRAVIIFRAAIGLLVFVQQLCLLPDVEAFYSSSGWFPAALQMQEFATGTLWSVHAFSDNYYYQLCLVILTAFAALSLTFDVNSRLSSVLLWALICSAQIGNRYIYSGAEGLLRVLLFWNIFLPHELPEEQLQRGESRICNIGTIGFIIQLCFVYFFGALLKSDPGWWRDGTAVYYALNKEPFVSQLGLELRFYPLICKWLTLFSFYLELLGPLFLFLPRSKFFRTVIPVLFILFHTGIALMLSVGIFPYVCIIAWVTVLPKEFWDRVLGERNISRVSVVSNFSAVKIVMGQFANLIGSVALVSIFLVMLTSVRIVTNRLPYRLMVFNDIFQIWQYWGMYSPLPGREDGWISISGYLEDGRKIELLCGGGRGAVECNDPNRETFDRVYPENRKQLFASSLWKKFLTELQSPQLERLRESYLNYHCRMWNRSHRIKLLHTELTYISELTPSDPYTLPKYESTPLTKAVCR